MRYRIASVALGLCIASCSPGGGVTTTVVPNGLPGTANASTASTGGTATIKERIVIPILVDLKGSRYTSPSTESVVVVADGPHRKQLAELWVDVRHGDKGCKDLLKQRQRVCTFQFSVPAGKMDFVIAALDGPKPKSGRHPEPHVLSGLITGKRVIKSGATVNLPMVLEGIPAVVTMELDPFDTFGTADDTQVVFAGIGPQLMHVITYDADKNMILGPGSPNVELHSDAPGLSIRKVDGNSFVLRPHGGGTGFTLTASAKAAIKGVTLPTTQQLNLTLASILYVANHGSGGSSGSVTEYVPWSDSPILTITSGISNPGVLTIDQSGNLWVGNDAGNVAGAGSIVEYPSGETTPSRTISGVTSPGVGGAEALAVDTSGNVYCACNTDSEVDEFTPAGGSTPSRTLTSASSPQGINTPYSVVTDSQGNLYVANYGSDSVGVSVFAPGSGTAPVRNITDGIHHTWLLVTDRLGNIYAGNYAVPNSITEYAPGGSVPINTFGSTSGLTSIDALAVDAAGNVYAGNYSASGTTGVQYSPSSPAAPSRTFSVPTTAIFGISADPIGNVYISNSNNSTVSMYPPGTGTVATRTLIAGNGIDTPWYVASSP